MIRTTASEYINKVKSLERTCYSKYYANLYNRLKKRNNNACVNLPVSCTVNLGSFNNVRPMLGDYATMLEKYADYEEKINAIDESKLTSEELAYYTKVTGRVLEKMSEIY